MKSATTKAILVSVIIPAYNEQLTIQKCLLSLVNQDYKNIEIIVVDDKSTDCTISIVKEFTQKKNININILANRNHHERSESRNFGAKLSTGEYLLFLDADMYISNKVISNCVKLIKNQLIKAVIIPEESVGSGYWAHCRHLEKKCYVGDESIEAARFFERDAFWKIEGWDPRMISGEDWDLTKRFRKKYQIDRINSKIFHNEGRLTVGHIFKKKFYYASKAQIYLKKYPLTLKHIILFVFRPAYFRNWKLFLSDPIHGTGVFVLKFIEIIAGGLGYLSSKILNPL